MNPEQAEQALRTYLRQRESLRLLMLAEPLDEPAIAEAAYELFNGPIPAGLEPDHLCRRSYASGQTISKP